MQDDKDSMVTISQKELAELRERLEDAEHHRKGLLEHTHNLEHLVSESSRHVKNLDHLLSESNKDLKQTQEKLKELEARCYRYEQLLQDYGKDMRTI